MPRKANAERAAQPRYPLNLRTNAGLRDQLEAAAQTSGRSLTQEATARLARSFDQDAVFGDPEVRRVAIAMSVAFSWLANTTRAASRDGPGTGTPTGQACSG